MNRSVLLILFFTFGSSSLLAQRHGDLLGFKNGDIALAKFLIKETNYPTAEVNTEEIHSSILVMLKFNITENGSIDSIKVLNPWPTDELFVKAAREALLKTKGMWSSRNMTETMIIPFVFVLEEREQRVIKRNSEYEMNMNNYFARVEANGESVIPAKILIPVYVHAFFPKPGVH